MPPASVPPPETLPTAAEPFTDAGTPAQQSQARLAKTAPGRMLNRLNTTYVLTLFWRISLRVLQLAFQR